MNLSLQQAFSSKAAKLLSWGHWFTFANIFLALLISSLYLASDPLPLTFSGKLFLLLNWLGHISFLTFIGFVLTIFPLSLVFPYDRHIRGMAAIVTTIAMSILAFDAYVYFELGYHLSPQVFEQVISLLSTTHSNNPQLSIFIVVALLSCILCFELIASNYAWRHLSELKEKSYKRNISSVFIFSFVMSHSIHIWADAKVNLDITKQDNVLPLSYPTTAKSLLARYELIDLVQYKQAQNMTFSGDNVSYSSPNTMMQCKRRVSPKHILVFEDSTLFNRYLASGKFHALENFYQPSNKDESLFNLIYGLPSYYQKAISSQAYMPAWSNSINTSFVNFPRLATQPNASLEIVYINSESTLKEAQKKTALFAYALSNSNEQPWVKSTLYTSDKDVVNNSIITPQDIIATVIGHYLDCSQTQQMTLGNDLFSDADSGVNISGNTLLIFKKDKLTLFTSKGEYKSLSAQQGFAINSDLDVPFLVESLKKLKQFEK
jgi:hypothetical protein